MNERPRAADADVVDRLARLRTILPLIATDLATARRRADTLERVNQRLTARRAEIESKFANPMTSECTYLKTVRLGVRENTVRTDAPPDPSDASECADETPYFAARSAARQDLEMPWP